MVKKKQQKRFDEVVRDLERQEFPEFANDDIYAPPENNNFYFAPSRHFRSGLLTQELVEDIRDNNRQILSVGTGAGYLERFLTKRLGVKRGQITLSDKYPIMPEGFERVTFDMYRKWPDFGKEFDYVIFPESVLLNVRFKHNPQRQAGLYHIVENSLATMKPVGQIRINGHCQIDENAETVKRWLECDHTDSRFIYDPALIVVERGYKK